MNLYENFGRLRFTNKNENLSLSKRKGEFKGR